MTTEAGLTARVEHYRERFATFLTVEVGPAEEELARLDVGTPYNPRLDDAGRMHPAVWEARREVQRRSAAAGLFNPHISADVGGGGVFPGGGGAARPRPACSTRTSRRTSAGAASPGWRCSTSRSSSTATPGSGWGSRRWLG